MSLAVLSWKTNQTVEKLGMYVAVSSITAITEIGHNVPDLALTDVSLAR